MNKKAGWRAEGGCFNPSQRVYSISSNYIDTRDKKASSLGCSVTVFIFKSNQFLRPNVHSTHKDFATLAQKQSIHPTKKRNSDFAYLNVCCETKPTLRGEETRERERFHICLTNFLFAIFLDKHTAQETF